jgi:hypothetical protein
MKTTMTIGGLVLTKDGSSYIYQTAGAQGLKIQLHTEWKDDVAMATVQFPKNCDSVQSAGSYRTAIEGALNYMLQEVEQEVRRANKRLEAFNNQYVEILALLGEEKDEKSENG